MTTHDINDLFAGVEGASVAPNTTITGIAYRSGRVRPGDAFFCIPGFAADGHDFASEAVERGARALVVQRRLQGLADVPQVVVTDTRAALAEAAAVFYGHPSRDVRVAGITGTNGKTTTTYLLDSIARAAGSRTGLIGTVETRIGDERLPAGRTTPESADLQEVLARMRDAGLDIASMEVSSHAIDLRRVNALHFAVAAFTNLTQDHLDYHHTVEEYFAVKRRLFTDLDVRVRVINVDDAYGAGMALDLPGVLTVGRADDAEVRAIGEVLYADRATFTLATPAGSVPVELPLAAEYNVSNALVAVGCALALDVPLDRIAEGLAGAPQVPGRLERVECGQSFSVFVDYAHTPDSLEKAISAVHDVTPGRVIVVFGCGGDRDPEKRPLMGAAAGRAADLSILTSDNSRSEDPVGIILQIEDGIREFDAAYEIEVDRRAAIARAFEQAVPGDAVLIAGKGHEDYQIFADRTIHFDDREVAREELDRWC